MLAVMQEDDGLIWSICRTRALRRLRLLRTLRCQYSADLTDGGAEVTGLRQRLRLIDHALADCMAIPKVLAAKQEG